MTYNEAIDVLQTSVAVAAPLLLAALGGLVAERAGVFSIGLEGYMLAGAFTGFVVAHFTNPWIGMLAAAAGGACVAIVHGVLSIRLRVDQIVSGIAMTILALGTTGYFNDATLHRQGQLVQIKSLGSIRLPGLSRLPAIGKILFTQSVFVYIAIIATLVLGAVFRWTKWGLWIHSAGEQPAACEARGLRVPVIRMWSVVFSGAAAGLGGGMLTLAVVSSFVDNMTNGAGFIALAAIIFAGWRLAGTVAACLLFGVAQSAQIWANTVGVAAPAQLLGMSPYVAAIVVLAVRGKASRVPAFLGKPL